MEDTQQGIVTNDRPSVLDIKPVQELEKVVEVTNKETIDMEELEDLKDDDIFIKPKTQKPKKKKVISERQKAHMKRMNEIRKQKREEKKKAKKPPLPPKTEVRKPVETKQEFTGHKGSMSNQAYMKDFFNNMNMFMDSYNKLEKTRKPQSAPQSAPQPVVKHAPLKRTKTMKPPQKVENNASYSIDFLKPNVQYKNYKNPWGF